MTWQCQCDGEGWCATLKRHVTPRQQQICSGQVLTPEKCAAYVVQWLAKAEAKEPQPAAAPAAPPQLLECPHRGPEVRRQQCGTCTGKVQIKIHGCALHGECSLSSQVLPGVQSCLCCRDRPKPKPRFVRTTQLVTDTYALARRLPPDLAGIIGVSRSGLTPASLLAQHLHLPLWILRQDKNPAQPDSPLGDITPAGNGWRIHNRPATPGPLLVVDDTQMTGRSISQAREVVKRELPGRTVLYAVIYRNPAVKPGVDFHGVDLPQPHILEWNFFNSIHLPHTAFDFDGIFTHDGTNEPNYLPRKGRVKLIITGRKERHRVGTMAWLARWGIKVERLVMLPDDADTRQPMIYSRHKAEHLLTSGLPNYVESCPIQAAEIAKLSGKLVICPTTAEVHP